MQASQMKTLTLSEYLDQTNEIALLFLADHVHNVML